MARQRYRQFPKGGIVKKWRACTIEKDGNRLEFFERQRDGQGQLRTTYRLTHHQRHYLISQFKDTQTSNPDITHMTPRRNVSAWETCRSTLRRRRRRRRAGSGTFSMRSRERRCKAPSMNFVIFISKSNTSKNDTNMGYFKPQLL